MSAGLLLLLGVPLAGGVALGFVRRVAWAARLNVLTSLATLLLAGAAAARVLDAGRLDALGGALHLDAFNAFLVVLTAFMGFTTAVFSGPYIANEIAHGRMDRRRIRLYHAMFQLFLFGMLLGFVANDIGVQWVSLELATLATVLLVSIYRTPAAIAAAWKYFVLCGVGIALALFGIVLVFFASSQVLGHHEAALRWSELAAHAKAMDGHVLVLAFAFLAIGYGTKTGLAPMHAWLPDAHGEGPTPISAVLSGLLLNLALYALVRLKIVVDAASGGHFAGALLMGLGLVSLLVAALALHAQRDIKRLFSFSSVEHMGIMSFAFGLGTGLAAFAALVHMTAHSLVKSAIFFAAGHAAQAAGSQELARIRGLVALHPRLGWGLVAATAAIAGMPPFGIFTGEFLTFTAAMAAHPWLAALLLVGLLVAAAALFRHLQAIAFGAPPGGMRRVRAATWPLYLHLALALVLGIAMPQALAAWYAEAASLIAGAPFAPWGTTP